MPHTLTINGKARSVDVDDDTPLLWVLRDVLGMTGTKFGCGLALCGACTIHLDGKPVRSCITPVTAAAGKRITTIEAIGATPAGKKIQQAWIELEVPQCGYCQSGQIMSATALLAANPNPTDADIDAAMSGNICRCGTNRTVNPLISTAPADVAGHGGVNVGVGRIRMLRQQRGCGHQLPGLAVAALRHLFGDPGELQRVGRGRRQPFN